MTGIFPHERFKTDTRGVTWTIEAFLSVALLFSILVISVQMIPAGPTTSQQAQQQESQLSQSGSDLLSGSDATGELSESMRYWDPENPEWHNSLSRHNEYARLSGDHPLSGPFGVLEDDDVLYNMEIRYQGSYDDGFEDETRSDTIVYQGVPSSNAVVVEYLLILDVDDPVIGADGTPLVSDGTTCGVSSGEEVTLEDADDCSTDPLIPQAFDDESTDRYNTVTVRLTLWN